MITLFFLSVDGLATGDEFGAAIVSLHDLDGDGLDDLVVGAPGDDSAGADAGAVYIYAGAASEYLETASPTVLLGDAGHGLGRALAVGDVDGDGLLDVAAAGSGCECVMVFTGASGFADSTTLTGTAGEGYGAALAVGDLDGDGFAEVVVGAPGAGGTAGAVYVHFGSAAGVASSAGTTLAGTATGDELGTTVVAAGDTNGDGIDDLLVGAPQFAAGGAGAAHVWFGSASGLATTADWTNPASSYEYSRGVAIAAGDFDADGFADVVAAAGGEGDLGTWYGSTAGPTGTASGMGTGDYGETVLAPGADGDGDGVDDLAWACWQDASGTWSFEDENSAYFSGDIALPHAVALAVAGDIVDDASRALWVGVGGGAGSIRLTAQVPDADGDRVPASLPGYEFDCDDADGTRHPGAPEVDGDGVDSNCDDLDDFVVTHTRACLDLTTPEEVRPWIENDVTLVCEACDFLDASWSLLLSNVDASGSGTVDSGTSTDRHDWGVASGDPFGAAIYTEGSATTQAWSLDQSTPSADGWLGVDAFVEDDQEEVSAYTRWPDGSVGRYAWEERWSYEYDLWDMVSYTQRVSSQVDNCSMAYTGDWAVDGTSYEWDRWEFDDGSHTLVVKLHHWYPAWLVPFVSVDGGPTYPVDPDTWLPLEGTDADGDLWPVEWDDCDDGDPAVYPFADELIDCVDNDCDGDIGDADRDWVDDCIDCEPLDPDIGGPIEVYGGDDADGDGYPGTYLGFLCDPPEGARAVGDCDDANATTAPGRAELCRDGADNDCDGTVDEDCWYLDADGDGYGDATRPRPEATNTVQDDSDCDDDDDQVHPAARDVPGDGVDQDCTGEDARVPLEPIVWDEVEPVEAPFGCAPGLPAPWLALLALRCRRFTGAGPRGGPGRSSGTGRGAGPIPRS